MQLHERPLFREPLVRARDADAAKTKPIPLSKWGSTDIKKEWQSHAGGALVPEFARLAEHLINVKIADAVSYLFGGGLRHSHCTVFWTKV